MPELAIPVNKSDHIRGNPSAPVTLVEYGDYECPLCGQAHPIVKSLGLHFGKQLRFVYRHFPLTQIHPNAENAAEAAEFAGAHGRFWEMHDAIFENQAHLGMPLLFALARALRLPELEMSQAIANGDYAPKIQTDFLGGVRSGVNGTPTFFVASRRYDGPFDFVSLVNAIESQLQKSLLRL
jgi:protein-disulfide isomerase